MIKLDKCPFCGGEAIFDTTSKFKTGLEEGFCFKIKCSVCNIGFPIEGKVSLTLEDNGTLRFTEDNRYELASKWNDRTNDKDDCLSCKYRNCEMPEKSCKECSHYWPDLYKEAEND